MTKTPMLLASALALMLAAGCGSNGQNAPGAAMPEAPAQKNIGNGAAEPPPDAAAESGNDGPDASETDNGESGSGGSGATGNAAEAPNGKSAAGGKGQPAANELSAAPKEPQYRMNKAYRFEAIAPGAPDKVVLLTFDDGPKEKKQLTSMLDTLDKHNAKAVFFVNGYRVKQNPDLLKLIAERGQTIGNHAWDHINLKKESKANVRKQIGDVQALVEKLTGEKPRMFRAPFGAGGDAVKAVTASEQMLYMTWSNGSLDWDKSTKDKPDAVIANVMKQLHPGANILMHELPWTASALEKLLTELEANGYGFIDPATIELPGAASPAPARSKASGAHAAP
ncbi:MAG TPA: polysaccharide deacetylase family protein [Paenibacillus sp.]|uniref:polysaccharide deacetylase family protein n=1 Tax=Paenibacillus sp. TaxID=58172 RepID=UPI002BD985E2|nr:polysaccharide deacetylase family protein [Paenibacillus sp.]HUC92374.1 polysaccharide deacetylase family protein [Paenibacillus sp.]